MLAGEGRKHQQYHQLSSQGSPQNIILKILDICTSHWHIGKVWSFDTFRWYDEKYVNALFGSGET